ncbi:MAG: helix-hairpin-helix domain-containing protein [Bacilli bacterium]|nr:helix-hairpin-helix domain-containing protein [Bacilli bacterium]
MKKIVDENKKLIIIIGIIIMLLTCIMYYLKIDTNSKESTLSYITTTTSNKINEVMYFDIKGNIKKPGVYEFKEGSRVIDAINIAGGLTKNADTSNINLSQRLTNEMVIYVYSNKDIKNNNKLSCDTICNTEVIEINNCIESNNPSTSKININTCTLEELTTIPGIGESKAKSIIEYRKTNKFNNIEDIKNVSGIGESLYENIKDYIIV